MKFLKRKFLLPMIGIVSLFVIASLHAGGFGKRANDLVGIRDKVDKSTAEKEKIRRLEDLGDLKALKADNKKLRTKLDEIKVRLKAKKPEAFYPAERSRVDVDIPEEATPEEKKKIVDEAFKKEKKKNDAAQYALIVSEIRKLWEWMPEKRGNLAGDTKLAFLGKSGWRVPTSLATGLKAEAIRDILREAAGTKEFMDIISKSNVALRIQQKQIFDAQIRRLGIQNALYADIGGYSLAAQGEFIPLLHKLCIAIMIEDELASVEDSTSGPLSREKLFELLELALPTSPLLNNNGGKEPISDLYFMYEGLRFANSLIDLAIQNEIKEVSILKIEEASYLVNIMDEGDYPWHEQGESTKRPSSEPFKSPYAFAKDGEFPQTVIVAPADGDIGYCIPVSLQFRATNSQGWKFIYSILGEHPLAEVNELAITAVKGANASGELIWRVTILGIPLLFVMDEDVRPDARKFSFSAVSGGGGMDKSGMTKEQQARAEQIRMISYRQAVMKAGRENQTDEEKAKLKKLRGGGKKFFFF